MCLTCLAKNVVFPQPGLPYTFTTPDFGKFSSRGALMGKSDELDSPLEDIPPLSKQILNLLLEANEIRILLGFWTIVNVLVLVILIYVAIKK
jgi:hypothetical protein